MSISLAAKGALLVAKSKTGRKIIGVIVLVIVAIILAPLIILSGFLSIFSAEGNIDSNFSAQETEVYRTIREFYDEYASAEIQEMQELAEKYREENMVQDTEIIIVYNPLTSRYEKREIKGEEYCKADIIVSEYQYISTSCTMAYLTCIHSKDYMQQKVKINKDELIAFWDYVNSGVLVDEGGTEEKPTYRIYNTVWGSDEIAAHFFSSYKQQEYKASVYLLSQYIGMETFGSGGRMDIELVNRNFDIPLYYQYASAWGKKSYGNGTISRNGCAPTCIAMVFSYLKGEIYPDDVVDFTGNQYYVNGAGSSWSIFSACAEHWNIECTAIEPTSGAIAKALSAGRPVILSVGPGTFTSSGHFIVLTGIDMNGQVTVNDPNDNDHKNFKGKKFNLTQIVREAKGGWSFE